ncbi:MAG: methionine adenosyltransferase domain-containing protein [Chloroflexota bacterium]
MSERRRFTSSSVMRGHPDKLCDRISDALVDAHLMTDQDARIRAEAAAAGQFVFVVTDARVHGEVDITGIVRATLAETRYRKVDLDPEHCAILAQSSVMTPPWAVRPDSDVNPDDLPAQEQTTVFGYACSETPERMPLAIRLAHLTAGALDRLSLTQKLPGLGPDGSIQITVEYDRDRPIRVDTVVLEAQFDGKAADLQEAVKQILSGPALQAFSIAVDNDTRLMINPEGPLLIGGPARNAGHTGRKQASDTYGGAARHGDGAMSGKDPMRLDRAAAYAARHAATNIVAAGLATECELMLSYAVGEVQPTTVWARTFGRGDLSNERLSEIIREVFDFRPGAIARRFRLWSLPREHAGRFYRELAVGGQVGRTDMELPWEQLDAVPSLQVASGALVG